jgi:hypothetical protein
MLDKLIHAIGTAIGYTLGGIVWVVVWVIGRGQHD